jgi:hypothetical protein
MLTALMEVRGCHVSSNSQELWQFPKHMAVYGAEFLSSQHWFENNSLHLQISNAVSENTL